MTLQGIILPAIYKSRNLISILDSRFVSDRQKRYKIIVKNNRLLCLPLNDKNIKT